MESPLIGHEFHFFGHRFHILESSRDTEEGSLRFEYFAPPRANIPEHVHTFQEERFEIVSGTLQRVAPILTCPYVDVASANQTSFIETAHVHHGIWGHVH